MYEYVNSCQNKTEHGMLYLSWTYQHDTITAVMLLVENKILCESGSPLKSGADMHSVYDKWTSDVM